MHKNNSKFSVLRSDFILIPIHYIFFSFILVFHNCQPPKEENICDGSTKTHRDTLILKSLLGEKTPFCGAAERFLPSSPSATSSGTPSPPAAPTIKNLLEKGIVHTGFMIGTAEADAASIEVSLDNGSYTTATGTTTWKFPFPTGSNTWKDASLHTIAVRVRNTNGVSSEVKLNVRKGNNKDINGDGYADVVVGAPLYNGAQGNVYVFHSRGSLGISSSLAATAANTILVSNLSIGAFGTSVATGDINGDGFADLVVGSSGYNSAQGRTYIFHSGGTQGITSGSYTLASTTITGPGGSSSFGTSVDTGDVNGDGFADLLIGASGTSFNTAYVIHSSGTSGISVTNAGAANSILTGTTPATDLFGTKVSFGDLNADGFADVIVGAPGVSSLGNTYIFRSTGSNGIAATVAAASATTIITGESLSSSSFGKAMAIGDVNGDGFLDLIVSANAHNTGTGKGYIFQGSSGGLGSTIAATAATAIITGTSPGIVLGTSVGSGDLNGDGFDDIVFGCKTTSPSSTGTVHIFNGSSSGITNGLTNSSANRTISGESTSTQFGAAVTLNDTNGDGYMDLIVGGDLYNTSQGRTYIFQSPGTSTITATIASSATSILTGESTSNGFGAAVASLNEWTKNEKWKHLQDWLVGKRIL